MTHARRPGRGPGALMLLGPPGAGKGTQAQYLARRLHIPHVASCDLLRQHRRQGTALGYAAQAYMDRGELVPDKLVVAMILERLEEPDAERGVLLDGFPRTLAQARILDQHLAERGASRTAIYLDVPTGVLVERLSGRRICVSCPATYHVVFNPPPNGAACGACGDELQQRPDDRREVVANRVEVYRHETFPILEHYAERGVLRRIDGDRPIAEVHAELGAAALAG